MKRVAFAWFACACAATEGVELSGPDSTSPSSTGATFPAPTCDPAPMSACGEASSIVQGQVRVASSLGRTKGDLFVALTHSIYDGLLGGGYHISTVVPDVDLSEPVPFAIDMCEGGAMWSEENCDYGLVVILDTNGDQGVSSLLPDDNEPATRVGGIRLSCAVEAPCLDIVLDCKGPDCVTFDDEPQCACDAAACPSIVGLCG